MAKECVAVAMLKTNMVHLQTCCHMGAPHGEGREVPEGLSFELSCCNELLLEAAYGAYVTNAGDVHCTFDSPTGWVERGCGIVYM